jgi:hypothetical protein
VCKHITHIILGEPLFSPGTHCPIRAEKSARVGFIVNFVSSFWPRIFHPFGWGFWFLWPMIFGGPALLFVSDIVVKDGRLEMRDFERFGLICDEWLEAAKEDTTTRRITSVAASNPFVATRGVSADAAAPLAYTSPERVKFFEPFLVTAA